MNHKLILIAILGGALVACASTAPPPRVYSGQAYPSAPARCYDCGVVERIEEVYGARENSRTGAVLGGVIGAVVGRELAGDETSSRNKNAGTAAGAVAGAIAGNAIENRANEKTWDITVRMDDGRRVVINRNLLGNGIRVGAYVRVEGNRLIPLR